MTLTHIQPILYYVYDPMCSWCWGYAPTWHKLKAALEGSGIVVKYQLGGLAADSNEPMPLEMQDFLQQTWRNISDQLGTQFNDDFWRKCQPRRSTYPACRAALIAREMGLEQLMIQGIQTAYYLEAKNPSNIDTLVTIATDIGLNRTTFTEQINSARLNQRLMDEINAVRQLPINGFPSLVLKHLDNNGADTISPIKLDYQHWQNSHQQIINLC